MCTEGNRDLKYWNSLAKLLMYREFYCCVFLSLYIRVTSCCPCSYDRYSCTSVPWPGTVALVYRGQVQWYKCTVEGRQLAGGGSAPWCNFYSSCFFLECLPRGLWFSLPSFPSPSSGKLVSGAYLYPRGSVCDSAFLGEGLVAGLVYIWAVQVRSLLFF